MAKEKMPVTPAIRLLRQEGVAFEERLYPYVEKGGTGNAAKMLGIDEHLTVKTLVMEDEAKNPLIVLMHGDEEVSTRNLARTLGVKSITPCAPETAQKHTGYLVGGTSPFGTRRQMPVYMEETIATLPRIYINGGKRGFLVSMDPQELVRVLHPTPVKVGLGEE